MIVHNISEVRNYGKIFPINVSLELNVSRHEYDLLQESIGLTGDIVLVPDSDLIKSIEDKKNKVLKDKLKAARELLKEHGELE